MNLDVSSYNRRFRESGKIVLDSDVVDNHPMTEFNLRLVEADIAPGETYWKVIGIHHLLPMENRGNHHVYLEALDEAGVRIPMPLWADNQFGNISEPVQLDKPSNEPAGNIPMFRGNTYKVRMRGRKINEFEKSDRVENLHINHRNEPLPPDGSGGNGNGRHSFYVVFQRAKKTGVEPEPEPVDFLQHASEHGLGNAVTPKFEFQQHQVQAFERGIVFARNDQPQAVQHRLW